MGQSKIKSCAKIDEDVMGGTQGSILNVANQEQRNGSRYTGLSI